MLSFKPRQLSEADLVEKLKIILNQCEVSDYKTKKFVGLLYDHIPYQTGLKIRLELIAKHGYLEQLIKLKRESNPTQKLEKLIKQFSITFGFVYEEAASTFQLLSQSLELEIKKVVQSEPTLRIVSSVQGNFSKKHFQPTETAPKASTEQAKAQPVQGKRSIKNPLNLFLYLLLLTVIPVGYTLIQRQYGDFLALGDFIRIYFGNTEIVDAWKVSIAIILGTLIFAPPVFRWAFKSNVMTIYPLLMLVIQGVLYTIYPKFPDLFGVFQLALGGLTFVSFAVLGFYAYRLPKSNKTHLSYQALWPYYLTALIWLGGQYLVLGFK